MSHLDHATVFDIETWVDWDFVRRSEFIDPILQSYEPPSNLRSPVAIAAHHTDWWMKKRKAWTFKPLTARVCSIAWGDLWSDEINCIASDDERSILALFAVQLSESPAVLTGYNVRRFDVPFLAARASVLGVTLPAWWPHERDYRGIADIMDVTGEGKLDQWLLRCEMPAKTGNGAMVEYMRLGDIEAYNRNDVHIERLLARRFAPNMPLLRATQPTPTRTFQPLPDAV